MGSAYYGSIRGNDDRWGRVSWNLKTALTVFFIRCIKSDIGCVEKRCLITDPCSNSPASPRPSTVCTDDDNDVIVICIYAMLTELMTLEHDTVTAAEDDASSEAAAAAAAAQCEAESH